jgi:8-oxo-dGTP diphosphatase
MKPIRNSAKAVIIENNKMLLTKNEDDSGYFYLLPGGGQEKGEELIDTVIRECLEEIGQEVEVNDLLHVREYIGKYHEFVEWDSDVHQVEFYFSCNIKNERLVMNGLLPDNNQVGVEWIEINKLDEIRLYPKAFGEMIKYGNLEKRYLGDIN